MKISSEAPVHSLSRGVDLVGWLAQNGGPPPTTSPARSTPALSRTRGSTRAPDAARRASAYLATLPPSISGEGGHARAFHAACILIKGFHLRIEDARPILETWNQGCQPPWSDRELDHKLNDADRSPDDRPRGWLLQNRSTFSRSGRSQPSILHSQSGNRPPIDPPISGETNHESDDSDLESRTNPHRLARFILARRFTHPDGLSLRYWEGDFHRWDGAAYRQAPVGELRALIAQDLADEFQRLLVLDREKAAMDGDSRSGRPRKPPTAAPVTTRLVGDVLQALGGLTLVPTTLHPSRPTWLPSDRAASNSTDDASWCDLSGWPASDLIAMRNALVHPPSILTGATGRMRPTPLYFNAYALDYDFHPDADAPRSWLAFLEDVWPDDTESVASLQEWFGYLLTSETRLQKILMMIGPKRSGRGTIARVLKALAGPANVVSPTLSTLARPFGLSVLIDKPVAVFPDARLSSRPDNAAIVESLLSISGEDDQAIDRKHRSAWTGRLPTRFVLISNELPKLRDASRALASRLVILRFTRSFYGKEDLALFSRLREELPGIFLWALEGWRRLQLRGRLLQPESGEPLLESMNELASPVAVFLEDCCVVESGASVAAAELYEAWREWCRRHGRDAVGDEQSLGRDLHAAIPDLVKRRLRMGGVRVLLYSGVRLASPAYPGSIS